MKYRNDKDIIRYELLDEEAQEQALKFYDKIHRKEQLSSAQLRRFFNEFRQLEKKIKAKGFEEMKPHIKLVKSKAEYASDKIPKAFKKFLIDHVNAINNAKDFEAFMLHFEAVVGFFYGIEGVKK